MIIYVHTISSRLRYIADFIGTQLGGQGFFVLTDDIELYKKNLEVKINYSALRIDPTEFFISPHSILFEEDIRQQQIICFEVNHNKAFYKTKGDFQFDIFAAAFFLLSRYEEYLPHTKDMYGRYAHENSLAFREGFLHIPLINAWILDFKKALQKKFPDYKFPNGNSQTSFLPTYDIDQAYSFKHKSFWKNANGFMRSLIKRKISEVKERWNVLMGKAKDPFDAYQWMDELNRKHKLTPLYFFIVADKPGKYDKNISPANNEMKELIVHHSEHYHIGIHPSWQSGDNSSLIKKEMQTVEQIASSKISDSRQHYIRFTLPQTFRYIIDAGIKNDYSMGYGSINGFRASVASSFYWFDLEKNEPTELLLHPFCYMDANSFYEQHYSPGQTYEEMMQYYNAVKAVNGTMISIWHNNFLGTDKLYRGWKEAYEKFVAEISS